MYQDVKEQALYISALLTNKTKPFILNSILSFNIKF